MKLHGIYGALMKYEFARFLVAGAVAALANLLSAWSYRMVYRDTRSYFEVSVALGFAVGTLVSFLLNRCVTFRATDGKAWVQFFRFILVGILAIPISMLVAHLLLRGLTAFADTHRAELVAHILTIGVMTVFNYFAIKHVAFAKAGICSLGQSAGEETR